MNKENWVCAWGSAPSINPKGPCLWCKDITFRFIIRSAIGGKAVRLHFSNLFGDKPAVISRVTVARVAEGRNITADSITDVTFAGEAELTMAPGEFAVSDGAKLDIKPGEELAVSMYLADFTECSTGLNNSSPYIRKYFSAGDATHRAELDPYKSNEAPNYVFLYSADYLAEDGARALVAYGDSITQQTWPDQLSELLINGKNDTVSVVRRAVSGSRVLREYPCYEYMSYGPTGLDRFEREVGCSGADSVVILHGINDIIHPDGTFFRPMEHQPTVEDLTAGLDSYVQMARKMGIKVYMCTLLPFCGWRTYNDEKEQIRLGVNEWIRTKCTADGVIDFDAQMGDPAHPLQLRTELDSGDHLHPGMQGAHLMAEMVGKALEIL